MSTQIQDSFGNQFNQLDNIAGEAIVDTRQSVYSLASLNAEVVLACQNTNSVSIDVRGASTGTLVVEYQSNGADYIQAPIFNPSTEVFLAAIVAAGFYVAHLPSGTKAVRVRMSVAGTANVALRGSEGDNFVYCKPIPTVLSVTATAAVSLAITATLPAPGAGLFHYITRLRISKYVGITLTAAAAPSIVTTTNLPSTPSFDFKTLGSLGDSEVIDIDFTGNPLKSTNANTASTIVAPVLTGAIWKVQAYYYVGA